MKKLTLARLLLIVPLLASMSSAFAQEDKLTVNTFYPFPQLTYKDLVTKEFISYRTDVTRGFRKNVSGYADPDPFVFYDPDPMQPQHAVSDFPFFDSTRKSFVNNNPIYFTLINRPLRVKPPTSVSTSEINTLTVNALENLARFHNITEWPTPTDCISTSQFYIGIYSINCGANGFLADISELPGFYIAIGAGGGNANFALGLGGGFKMGFVNYTCCQIAGLSGGGWVPPGDTVRCHDQFMVLQTRMNELKVLLDQLYGIVNNMQANGCCSSQDACQWWELLLGRTNHEAVDSNGNQRHCCLPVLHRPVCTDLSNQYRAKDNEVNIKRNEVNTAKNNLCTCMCEGDASCLNNCITP